MSPSLLEGGLLVVLAVIIMERRLLKRGYGLVAGIVLVPLVQRREIGGVAVVFALGDDEGRNPPEESPRATKIA